jgi:hypothetical protein
MKMFSNASNARRGARQAGLTDFAIVEVDGKFGFEEKFSFDAPAHEPAPEPTKADKRSKAIAAVEASKPPRKAKAVKAPKAPKVAKAAKAAARKSRPPSEKPGTKGAQLIAMVTKGATITELMEALGWLPHTTRGALSRLSTAGYTITRTKVGAESHYIAC